MIDLNYKNTLRFKAELILKGHILNPLWKSRAERRYIRCGVVTRDAICRELRPYVEYIRTLTPETPQTATSQEENPTAENAARESPERIFSMWLQGEDNAPEIVKACWRSVRENCRQPFVILDENSLAQWVDLPEHIVLKRKEGKIMPAHFADICRLALLVKYGGLWLDATDFIPNPLPDALWGSDFFVYTSGHKTTGAYAGIQNCFIRAKKGTFLAKGWLELIYEYWKREDCPIDYFVHQLLFMMMVKNNPTAAKMFAEMPKINHDMAHELWFSHRDEPYDPEVWKEVTSRAMFQKTEYKSESAKSPVPGSFAWHMIKNL